MHFKFVELFNWRSYRHARFEFPTPQGEKNVVLIRAPNEYGKTSFFEAVTLGLFGRLALPIIPRVRYNTDSDLKESIKESYSAFLSKTLHYRAINGGPAQCRVTIGIEDDEQQFEITRIWHFRQSGQHKPAEDELRIFQGEYRTPVTPPQGTIDSDEWYREWIAQRFLSPNEAEFFLFDGEQVQQYATRPKQKQVRNGIRGLLGLPILEHLRSSLDSYAQRCRSNVRTPKDSTINEVRESIERLSSTLDQLRKEGRELDELLPNIDSQIQSTRRELGNGSEATVAMVGRLIQDEQRHLENARKLQEDLLALIHGDVALAIASASLSSSTKEQLRAELIRAKWEESRDGGVENLIKFKDKFLEYLLNLDPPIDEMYHENIIEAAETSWNSLWYPTPEGCAEFYIHSSLTSNEKSRAIDRLDALNGYSIQEIGEKEYHFKHSKEQAQLIRKQWQEMEAIAPEVERLTQSLTKLSEERGSLQTRRNAIEREINSVEGDLKAKKQEFGRYTAQKGTNAPELRRAEMADEYVSLIDRLLVEAIPREIGEVAKEMTLAWKSMAHMSDRVDRIEITDDCRVKMLAIDGTDLRDIEPSAGASQVFTQALITAIAKVSGRTFPFIVDTPLARLSREQRLGVLRTFTERLGQVVLLSTDEEVVDDKLDAIRERIAAAYELVVHVDRGVAISDVREVQLDTL